MRCVVVTNVDQEKINLYKLLYKAQLGFDMIADCLEEKDYEMAMLIASKISLSIPDTIPVGDTNAQHSI